MKYRVTIRQHAQPIEVETGQTIVDAALAAGVPYPHGCRAGNCSGCKSVLLSGEVDLLPYSPFALPEEERATGRILACRAVPWSDCEVEYLEDDELTIHPLRRLRTRVIDARRATRDITMLRLRIEAGGPFVFSAGQYASLTFPETPPRDFSMANPPSENVLEFHARSLAGGAATSYIDERIRPGDEVSVQGPYGDAYLRERHLGPIVLAAGSTGLAPILSILKMTLQHGRTSEIRLYVGARSESDLYLQEELRLLERTHDNLRVETVLSEAPAATTYRTGFLCDAIAADAPALDGWKAYLAGPPVMVETTVRVLLECGLPRGDIHADAFYPAGERLPSELRS